VVVAVMPPAGKAAPALMKKAVKVETTVVAPSGVELWTGKTLAKKLKKNPQAQAKRCKAEPACLGALFAASGASHVISIWATPAPGGAQFEVSLVVVASSTAVEQRSVSGTDAAAFPDQLNAAVAALVSAAAGVAPPASPPMAAVVPPAPPAPTTPPTPVPPPVPATPAPATPTATATAPETAPATAATSSASAETVIAAPANAAETPEAAPVSVETTATRTYPTWWTWAGTGAVALGVAGLVSGAALAARANDLRDVSPRATQLDVMEQEVDQHAAATGSAVLYTVGGVLLTAGLGLAAWDLWHGVVAVHLAPSPGGAQVSLGAQW
jgi:hypothetical protein